MSHQISYDPVSMRWALSDGSHYLELQEWAYEILADEHERETKQLKSENAKLRELVQDMRYCIKRNHRCDDCDFNVGTDCLLFVNINKRMRELGVETEE